jgi:hypothetical protein
MSDTVLKFIPTEPFYIPDARTHASAVALLEKLMPEGEMCKADVYEHLTFIEQGENLESVTCSSCEVTSRIYGSPQNEEIGEWLSELIEQSVDMPANSIIARMPCCGNEVSFSSLTFDWPAGFGCFELSIWNPEVERPVPADVITQLEVLLGCKLQQIWAHY